MTAYQPRIKHYTGFILLESQPRNWIRKHRSFASYEWLYSQVKFGLWVEDTRYSNHFSIEVKVLEGIKPLIILIKFELLTDKVRVYHCHTFKPRK